MQKWEYFSNWLDMWDTNIDRTLNEYGEEGWELVSIKYPPTLHQQENTRGIRAEITIEKLKIGKAVVVFKRPIA